MMIMGTGAILNIMLDPILMKLMGEYAIEGAAIATVLSQIVQALLTFHYFSKKSSFVKIHKIKKQKYDIAVQTTTGDRGIIVAKYAKIKTIVGFEGKNKTVNKMITHKAPKIGGLRHTVDRNLDALAALGFEPSGKRVSVYFDPDCISHLNLPPKFERLRA